VDAVPTTGKFLRSLVSSRRKFLMSSPSVAMLGKVVDLARAGKMPLTIGRIVRLEDAISFIKDLEAGRRVNGKSVVVMP